MISRAIRLLLRLKGANLKNPGDCEHRTPSGGQAFAAFRHSESLHVFICTQCGLVERESYEYPLSPAQIRRLVKRMDQAKNLARNDSN